MPMEQDPAQSCCGLIARRLSFGQPIQCDREFAHANTTRMPDLIGDRTRAAGPSARVLDRIGDKWSVLVVAMVGDGPKRFNELRRAIASISQRMLTLTLRPVVRAMFPTIPPRVDYALTELGCSLLKPVNALGPWRARSGVSRRQVATAWRRQATAIHASVLPAINGSSSWGLRL